MSLENWFYLSIIILIGVGFIVVIVIMSIELYWHIVHKKWQNSFKDKNK